MLQTFANESKRTETKASFRSLLRHPTRRPIGPIVHLLGPTQSELQLQM